MICTQLKVILQLYLQVSDVIKNSPSSDVGARYFNEMEVNAVEQQRERLQVDQNGHQVVDFEDWMSASEIVF
jgi:hypothetical protein